MVILKLATVGLLGMAGLSALAQAPPIDMSAGVQAGVARALGGGDRTRAVHISAIAPAN